jgi:hypothetical protein
MYRALFKLLLVLCISTSSAEKLQHSHDVKIWQEVTKPDKAETAAYESWYSAANLSKNNWRVFLDDGKILADQYQESPLQISKVETRDGWLIGFNEGEWGGALYWFGNGSQENYKILDHQIIRLFSTPKGIFALSGLSHLGVTGGSLEQVSQPTKPGKWQVKTIQNFSLAPYSVSMSRDGTLFVVLSGALVSLDQDHKLNTLLLAPEWEGLLPNSSVLSEDENKLYVGMRKFVGEFDLKTKKLRYWVPN